LLGRPVVSYTVHADELSDSKYGETRDVRESAKVNALLLANFWNRWEYCLRELTVSTQKVVDIILIHDDIVETSYVLEKVNEGAYGLILLTNFNQFVSLKKLQTLALTAQCFSAKVLTSVKECLKGPF